MRNSFPRQDKICHLEPLKAQPEIPKAQQDNEDEIKRKDKKNLRTYREGIHERLLEPRMA